MDQSEPVSKARVPEVWFFLPQLGGGGAEMNAVRLASPVAQAGLRPVFVVARGPGAYEKDLPPGTEVVTLPTGSIASSTWRMVRSVRPLARIIEARRPAVICAVMPQPSLAALAAVRLATYKPRVVLSVQNTLRAPMTRPYTVYERIELALARRAFPAADRVIALSRGVAGDLAETIPGLEGRIAVVYNSGLPLPEQVARPEPDIPPRTPGRRRFLACGRLVEQKGYRYLLDALAQVVRTVDAELHILGEGPLRAELQAHIDHLGLTERVRFLGFRRNPFAHMREADVFVLSSLWEGFGNVIVEAMAMDTPVISTACPHGPDEIIRDGHDGLLVPPADADALAAAMTRLAADDHLRRRLAAAGQERAQDFAPSRVGLSFARELAALSSAAPAG